jgi:broad specificity phosphatase PhoE
MRLILIRHGESVGNTKKGYISGRDDPEGLTVKGKSQVIRTAYELRKEQPERIYVSPVMRARQTSEIVNTFFQTKIETCDWLTELHHGILEGRFWWEVIDQIPQTWRSKREDYETPYPGGGGESMQMLLQRISTGMTELLQNLDPKGTYVIVSHQAVIAALRYYFLYGSAENVVTHKQISEFLQFIHHTKLPNAGYVEVDIGKNKKPELAVCDVFAPIKERKDNVMFYFKGIFAIPKKLKVHKYTTASSNTVSFIQFCL